MSERTLYLFELETEDSWVCPSCMTDLWSSTGPLYHISESGDLSLAVQAFLEERGVYCFGCIEKELVGEIFSRFGEGEFGSRRYRVVIEVVKIPDDVARDIELFWSAKESCDEGEEGDEDE
jgi:hypothetical protein